MSAEKAPLSAKEERKLKRQHLKIQDSIKRLPVEQQEVVRAQQRIVDGAIAEANDLHFNGSVFAVDGFLATHGISGSDRERFIQAFTYTNPGKTFIWTTRSGYKAFYRTLDNHLMAAEDYTYTLEYSLINASKMAAEKLFTSLSTWDIIKLALTAVKNKIFGG